MPESIEQRTLDHLPLPHGAERAPVLQERLADDRLTEWSKPPSQTLAQVLGKPVYFIVSLPSPAHKKKYRHPLPLSPALVTQIAAL